MTLPQLLNRLSLLIHARVASNEAIHVTVETHAEIYAISEALSSVELEHKFSLNDFVRAMLVRSRAKPDAMSLWSPDMNARIEFANKLAASLNRAAVCAEVAVMAAIEIAHDSRWNKHADSTKEGAAALLKFIDEKVFVMGGK